MVICFLATILYFIRFICFHSIQLSATAKLPQATPLVEITPCKSSSAFWVRQTKFPPSLSNYPSPLPNDSRLHAVIFSLLHTAPAQIAFDTPPPNKEPTGIGRGREFYADGLIVLRQEEWGFDLPIRIPCRGRIPSPLGHSGQSTMAKPFSIHITASRIPVRR